MTLRRLALTAALLLPTASCDSPSGGGSELRFPTPEAIPELGVGTVARVTSELTVHGNWAYTGTYVQSATVPGNTIFVWNVAGNTPVLVDSVIVPGAPAPAGGPLGHPEGEGEGHGYTGAGPAIIGDLQVSDDGRLLVAATEGGPGSIVIYDLEHPDHPHFLTRYSTPTTEPGVHTAELARVNGRLYAFLSIDPKAGTPARLAIVDLADPANPVEVWSAVNGDPIQHDVFVRAGILFTAEWDAGVGIWDIGGGGRGGSVSSPVLISRAQTVNGNAHNVYWSQDRRWLFVGEETSIGGGLYRGDIHVLDVEDLASPREVAFFHVEGAGAHNFSVDDLSSVLYSAFYNGGVRALDILGDLDECEADAQDALGRCDLALVEGRLAGLGLNGGGREVMIWGVEVEGNRLYASDMRSGLWKLDVSRLLRFPLD